MLLLGVLIMVSSVASGMLLAWENPHTLIQVKVFDHLWTGHLYGVLIIGALMACWFLFGAAFIQCRVTERRGSRRVARRRASRQASQDGGTHDGSNPAAAIEDSQRRLAAFAAFRAAP